MLKITQIEDLFKSSHKLTTQIIPKEILHPGIETKLIEQYGDSILNAYYIGVFSKEINNFVPYICIVSPKGNMYRIECIETGNPKEFDEGYAIGYNKEPVDKNPYNPFRNTQKWRQWGEGYHQGYKHATDNIPY